MKHYAPESFTHSQPFNVLFNISTASTTSVLMMSFVALLLTKNF